jgi:hypothetical protein
MGQGDDRDELEANEIFSVRHEFLTDKQHVRGVYGEDLTEEAVYRIG